MRDLHTECGQSQAHRHEVAEGLPHGVRVVEDAVGPHTAVGSPLLTGLVHDARHDYRGGEEDEEGEEGDHDDDAGGLVLWRHRSERDELVADPAGGGEEGEGGEEADDESELSAAVKRTVPGDGGVRGRPVGGGDGRVQGVLGDPPGGGGGVDTGTRGVDLPGDLPGAQGEVESVDLLAAGVAGGEEEGGAVTGAGGEEGGCRAVTGGLTGVHS